MKLDRILQGWFFINEWPRWMRRVFLVTAPVSYPVWVAVSFVIFFVVAVIGIYALAMSARDLWSDA